MLPAKHAKRREAEGSEKDSLIQLTPAAAKRKTPGQTHLEFKRSGADRTARITRDLGPSAVLPQIPRIRIQRDLRRLAPGPS